MLILSNIFLWNVFQRYFPTMLQNAQPFLEQEIFPRSS